MKLGLAVFMVVVGGAACDSNPTPHPQQDAVIAGRGDTTEPEPAGPDNDNDGIADCTEVQGFWDGEQCRIDNDPSLSADADDGASADALDDSGDVLDDATAPDTDQ